MKDRSPNRREFSLDLPADVVASLPPDVGAALNRNFKVIADALSAASGLRGTMNIARQKKMDERSIQHPGMRLEGGRVADLADPIDPQDAATRAWVLEQLKCENLRGILEKCTDADDPEEGDEDGDGGTCQPAELSHQQSTTTGLVSVPGLRGLYPFIYLTGQDGDGVGHFQVYRSQPTNVPIRVADIELSEPASRMVFYSGFAFLITFTTNLLVVNVSEPDAPVEVTAFDHGITANDICSQGEILYLVGDGAIRTISVANPGSPVQL